MRIKYLLFTGIVLLLIPACRSSGEISTQQSSNPVIATIGDENVTLDELKINYNRNRNGTPPELTEIREFFPSYIEYRLKLHEGIKKGFHQDSTILAEYNQYASEIAYRYWIENTIKKERQETFKKRFEHELKAFHILKELPGDAMPNDTTAVYHSLLAVRDSLKNGASPEEMNERHSTKREGRPVGGQLSWITAGSTIEPFEDALYRLPTGEISYPVRTQFGYHLIILQDIRPRTPQRFVKHIFVRNKEDGTGLQKIHQALRALQADTSWSDVVKRYSEDRSTVNRDGSLEWVGYGDRFPSEFIAAVMETSPDSAPSQPLEMNYGYQILKVDSVRTFEKEEQKDEFIVDRLQQLGRLNADRESVYERIALESDLKIHRKNFRTLLEHPGISNNEMNSASEIELVQFSAKKYSAGHFKEWLQQEYTRDIITDSGDIIKSYRDSIIEKNLVEFTKHTFPDFANEVDHFLDGLIVFKVNQESIWNPALIDRYDLKDFYESNRNEYKTEKMFHYTEISASSESLMDDVYQKLLDNTEINDLVDNFEDLYIQSETTGSSQDFVFSILEDLQPGKFSEPKPVANRISIYILDDMKEERIPGFEEVYDKVLSTYLPIHENKVINRLMERYNVEMYPENLN